MPEEFRASNGSFFEDELDAFRFRNEMRKRPDYQVKYHELVGLSSSDFYDRIRQENESLSSGPIPTVVVEEEFVDEIPETRSRFRKLTKLFSTNDAS
jgi:hypothetical protein